MSILCRASCKLFAVYLLAAVCLIACDQLPSMDTNLLVFDGSWMVDMEASLAASPDLRADAERRLYLRQLVMIINMESRQIIMGHGRQQNRAPYRFMLLKQALDQALIKLEAGAEIELVKQGNWLLYHKRGSPEELVFKPMFGGADEP